MGWGWGDAQKAGANPLGMFGKVVNDEFNTLTALLI